MLTKLDLIDKGTNALKVIIDALKHIVLNIILKFLKSLYECCMLSSFYSVQCALFLLLFYFYFSINEQLLPCVARKRRITIKDRNRDQRFDNMKFNLYKQTITYSTTLYKTSLLIKVNLNLHKHSSVDL